jgi:hypothetical protein
MGLGGGRGVGGVGERLGERRLVGR